MTQTNLMDKYPVWSKELNKADINFKSVDEIIEALRSKIEAHKIATFIGVFDNYTHTKNIEGKINPDILDAKILLFCFGNGIANTKILAVRPRGFAVCEQKDRFIIDFMDAPKEELTETMKKWVEELK